MIVYMRGTSGAGKSYVGFQFIETYPAERVEELGWVKTPGRTKLVAHKLPGDLYLAGRYNVGTPTGGVDGFTPYAKIIDLVERLAAQGHVYVELRSSFGLEYLQRWDDKFGITVCYLDTPLETCVQNVLKRRTLSPITRADKLNVDAMRTQQNQLFGQMKRYRAAGINVALIDHTNSFNNVRSILWRAGWRP